MPSSLLTRLKKYFSPNRKPFACESDIVVQTKDSMQITEQSFLEVYKQTRELANDIITKLEDNRKRVKILYTSFNAASDLIVIFDSLGTIVYANYQFLVYYNYTEEYLIGKNITEICGNDRESYNNMWNTVIKNKVWEGLLHCKDSDGNDHSKQSKILPIMNGVPAPIYYVCSQSRI